MIDDTYIDNDNINGKPIYNAIDDTDDRDNNVQRKPVNNKFLQSVGYQEGATRKIYEHEGVLYVQNCHYGEIYYQPYEIYDDDINKTEEVMDRMAHSSKLWSLCDNAPSFQDNSMLRFEMEYNQHVIKTNQRLAYQGVLDNCKDVGITKTKLQKAQAPLNPSIRQPKMKDWERKRKYSGNVPADII